MPQGGGFVMQHGATAGGQRMPLPQVQHYFLEGMRPDLAYMNNFALPRNQPASVQKTETIRNDVNLKKNTLKLLRDEANPQLYHLEFVFDASLECCISVHWAATEEAGVSFAPLREGSSHPKEDRPKGLGQTFRTRPEHALDMSLFGDDEALLTHTASHNRFPLVICLEVAPSDRAQSTVQSQTTYANLKPNATGAAGTFTVLPLKQKIQVGSSSYELQEIYGIEGQKAAQAGGEGGDDANGRECVICMTDPRDTTVLPCRHMCMCSGCAKVLRLQSNKCPICRTHIESLLQIKVAKEPGAAGQSDDSARASSSSAEAGASDAGRASAA